LASKLQKLDKASKTRRFIGVASMGFPLRIPDQLKPHLRALRKSRGLTQGQLGAWVGVRQARIAEIEANPGAVSLDQLTKVLAALGGTLHLHIASGAGTESRAVPDVRPKAPQPAPMSVAKRTPKPSSKAVAQLVAAPTGRRSPTRTTKPASVTSVVIRPKKGTW
jgi:HTH-type transcriptional regulator/antitoxin HipB